MVSKASFIPGLQSRKLQAVDNITNAPAMSPTGDIAQDLWQLPQLQQMLDRRIVG